MALGVLNNISAVYAQNNLATTQSSLQKTLQQLSSGSRINSGADDAAGLSLANGLQASATALSQSAKNASQGVDLLQVADGALSQVTSLLNRGVTLATEASNGTLNSSQRAAADAEYQKILGEIDTINGTTKYNGINVFRQSSGATTGVAIYTSDGSALGATTYNNATTDLVATDTKSLGVANGVTFTGGFLDITGAANPGAATVAGNLMDSAGAAHSVDIAFTKVAGDANTWTYATTKHAGDTATSISGGNGAVTFDGKGSVVSFTGSPVTLSGIAGASDLTFTLDLGSLKQGVAADPTTTTHTSSLISSGQAQAAINQITDAIALVATARGTTGANINTLSAVGNVMTTTSTNTLAAQNDVTATDYGQATSDMSKLQILTQTGIAALAQANQSQQSILKLLQ